MRDSQPDRPSGGSDGQGGIPFPHREGYKRVILLYTHREQANDVAEDRGDERNRSKPLQDADFESIRKR